MLQYCFFSILNSFLNKGPTTNHPHDTSYAAMQRPQGTTQKRRIQDRHLGMDKLDIILLSKLVGTICSPLSVGRRMKKGRVHCMTIRAGFHLQVCSTLDYYSLSR